MTDPEIAVAPEPAGWPQSYAQMSRNLSTWMFNHEKEWAGLPMPIPRLRLTVEETHPWRDRILAMQEIIHEDPEKAPDDDEAETADNPWTVRNQWFSRRLGVQVGILTDGQRVASSWLGSYDYVRRFKFAIDTMQAGDAWTVETEITAQQRLGELLAHRPHLFKYYQLTGSFIETSARSGVTYLFRRCRPTVAFRNDRVLCTLCLHPIGYYDETHAGSMCPTDDVIAHLLMMRADEPFFWRRANQHAPWMPESGL
jgi:hypothetical protein